MMARWIKRSENAGRPVLVTITNKKMGVHIIFSSKYGKETSDLPIALVNDPDTEVKVEFLDMKGSDEDEIHD